MLSLPTRRYVFVPRIKNIPRNSFSETAKIRNRKNTNRRERSVTETYVRILNTNFNCKNNYLTLVHMEQPYLLASVAIASEKIICDTRSNVCYPLLAYSNLTAQIMARQPCVNEYAVHRKNKETNAASRLCASHIHIYTVHIHIFFFVMAKHLSCSEI